MILQRVYPGRCPGLPWGGPLVLWEGGKGWEEWAMTMAMAMAMDIRINVSGLDDILVLMFVFGLSRVTGSWFLP